MTVAKNSRLSLENRKAAYKRRYKRTLGDLYLILQGELEGIEDKGFEPSTALESTFLSLVKEGNRLKALLEVEE
jgi:hypothetical protein